MDTVFGPVCKLCVCSDGIYHYMKKQTGPDSVHLKTEQDLQTFINNYDASIVGRLMIVFIQFVLTGSLVVENAEEPIGVCSSASGVFSGPDSSRLAEFLKAAGLLREQFRFAHSTDLKLGEEHGVSSE